MDKQELIENVKELTIFSKQILNVKLVDQYDVIKLIERLDEPQKPVVPQFVADWYEKHKDDFEFKVWDYVYMFDKKEDSDFKKWFNDSKTKPFQILVNMHQFGYTVEKEKRYLVKMKDLETGFNFLNRHKRKNYWVFSSNDESITYQVYHTHKELEEAGFGWVFNSPLFEVEEV